MRRSLSSAALLWSAAALVTAGCASQVKPPTPKVTVPSTAAVGVWTSLDASGSTDPNSPTLPLSFTWSVTQQPPGSTAAINNPSSLKPSFKPDVTGDYNIHLTVTNGLRTATVDSKLTAGPCGVQAPGFAMGSVTATPAAPATGQAVTLAAMPTDPDNDMACNLATPQKLTVKWAIVAKPLDSQSAFLNAGSDAPSFIPDQPGDYQLRATVTDSTGLSSSQDLKVTANACGGNAPVITEVDPSLQKPAVGTPLQLAAVVTDADNTAACTELGVAAQDVTYAWTIRALPVGSHAALSSLTAKNPSITPDVAGDYLVQLVVTDTTGRVSAPVSVSFTAATCGPQLTPPMVGPAGPPAVGKATVFIESPTSSCPASDAASTAFTYAWSVTQAPAGAHPTLANATTSTPSFTPDVTGDYTLHLVVADGDGRGSAIDASVTVNNYSCGTNIPAVTSVAPAPASPGVGAPTQLTATVVDADNDPAGCNLSQTFTYAWSVVNVPAGSKAALNGTTLAQPTLVPDMPGVYQLSLVVTDSTGRSAAPYSFVITVQSCGTNAPVIDSLSQTVNPASITVGTPLAFQATVHDPDNGASCASVGVPTQALTYQWQLVTWPAGSIARLQGATTLTPSFTPDMPGAYALQLTVTDSTGLTATSSISVTVNACGTNTPVISGVTVNPAAPAITEPVTLTASATDADNTPSCGLNQALDFTWAMQSAPAGSTVTVNRSSSPTISFTPDTVGAYVFDVTVSDGTGRSSTTTKTVTVGTCAPPVAKIAVQSPITFAASTNVGPFTIFRNNTLWFDASASTVSSCAPVGTTLKYSWSVVSLPAGAPGNGGMNSFSVVNPSAGPLDATGEYIYQLVVSDGYSTSAPATLTVDVQGTVPGEVVLDSQGATSAGNVSVSMTVDPTTGRPAYAYFDQSSGAVRVAFCTANCDTNAATFRVETVASSLGTLQNPGGSFGVPMRGVGFAVTKAGIAEVAYYEPSKCTFAFAWRSSSGTWTSKDILASPGNQCGTDGLGSGGSLNNSFGRDLALALRTDDLPGIAFLTHNRSTGQDSLQFVECNDATNKCQTASPSFSNISTPATADATSNNAGYEPSLKYTSANRPRVASYSRDQQNLHYSFCDTNCTAGNWNNVVADPNQLSGNVGRLPSLVLNSADSPRISYTDAGNNNAAFASCDSQCNSQGNWNQVTVDDTMGDFTSLALDAQGNPYVAYTNALNGGGPLMLSVLQSGNWTRLTVDNTRSFFYTGIVLTGSTVVHIAYGDGSIQNRGTKSYYTSFGL